MALEQFQKLNPVQIMENKYVDFVSDEYFLECVASLHKSYLKAKKGITKKKLFKNKVDTIKLAFDAKFNGINEEDLVEAEILRQIDKSVNNSIGTFHEQILGGIAGFEIGNKSGYDIKAKDNSIFAEIKNKHNTMSSRSAASVFSSLADYADRNVNAKCYLVQILSKSSYCIPWKGRINKQERGHSRVFKISGDQFYELVTGKSDSFFQLYKALPQVVADYLESIKGKNKLASNSALSEINDEISKSGRSILDQITFENYSYYLGFDKL